MKQFNRPLRARLVGRAQQGMTLIELLVAMLISLVLSLAIFGVLASSEGLKRTTTSVNDINQTGNYAMYTIDKWVRSAGSGFAQSAAYAFGCTVHASRSGTQVLPAGAAAPAPFDGINTTGTVGAFKLAPILIAPGQTTPGVSGAASDALIVMAGSAGYGESAVDLSDLSAANELKLTNTVSFKANDIVLVANRQGATGAVSPCMIQQVSAVAGKAVSLGGAYANASIGSESLTAMPLESAAINLGNVVGNNAPTFLMIGVGRGQHAVQLRLAADDRHAAAAHCRRRVRDACAVRRGQRQQRHHRRLGGPVFVQHVHVGGADGRRPDGRRPAAKHQGHSRGSDHAHVAAGKGERRPGHLDAVQ